MTFVMVTIVGVGAILIASALEDTSIASTLQTLVSGSPLAALPTSTSGSTTTSATSSNGGVNSGGPTIMSM